MICACVCGTINACCAHAQVELNKKREAELQRMKRDMEEQIIQSEAALNSIKKRSQEAVNELNDQLDQLSKAKSKVEKERNQLKGELDDIQGQLDVAMRGKVSDNAHYST